MSGIYIPGMEMPTSCAFCRFCDGLADTLKGTCAFCMVDGKYREARKNDDCPLVPVPDHGDLIERQAVLNTFSIHMNRTLHFVTIRDTIPTIIPADHIGDATKMVSDKEGET